MGIDRKAFIDITLEANRQFQDYTLIPGWEWHDATLRKNFARDVEEAKKLVSAAGKTGAKLVISTFKAGPAGQNEQATQLVMSNLKDIGLELTMESVPDFTTFNNTVTIPGKYQMMLLVAGDAVEPDTFLSGYLSDAPATLSRMRVKDTKLDGMIKEQRTLTDASKRKSAIALINQHLSDNMYVAPTAQVVVVSATQPWVQRNGTANHISGTLRPELIWLDKK